MMNKKNCREGLTIVELLISILIFSIVLGLGYLFFQRTFKSLERQKQTLDTLHEARRFLALIEKDLRQMVRLISLDTVYKGDLFHEQNAIFFAMELEIPDPDGAGNKKVTYSYEGPDYHKDEPSKQKVIYRQEEGKPRVPVVTKQMGFLKIWGTDGVIFRNQRIDESKPAYSAYLRPHYYSPTNNVPNGLRELDKVKGVEVQLRMHEMFDNKGTVIKDRTFITRIYSRVLNSKYEN